MPVTLSATPLPDEAAIRLRLDALPGGLSIVFDEDYRVMDNTAAAAAASAWTPTAYWTAGTLDSFPSKAYPQTFGVVSLTHPLTGLTIGQGYMVYVAGSALVTRLSVNTTVATTKNLDAMDTSNVAPPVGTDAENSPLAMYFVATATSHTLTVTKKDGINQRIWDIVVREVPAGTLVQEFLPGSSMAASWTASGTVPAGASRALTTVGSSTYYANLELTRSSGTPTVAAGTQSMTASLTGLTIGQQYIVRAAGAAQAMSGGSIGIARWSIGVDTIGAGAPSASTFQQYVFVATATSHTVRLTLQDPGTYNGSNAFIARLKLAYLRVENTSASLLSTYEFRSLRRSDDNGSREVRLYEGQGLSDGVLITVDPEAAFTGTVNYTAEVYNTSTSASEYAFASLAGSTAAPDISLGGRAIDASWLAPASLPNVGGALLIVTEYNATRPTNSRVDRVIGRTDPVVTLGRQGTREGRMQIWCQSYAESMDVISRFNQGEIMLFRQQEHAGLDMYFVATEVSQAFHPEIISVAGVRTQRWLVEIDYVETAAPLTPLLGSVGWTIAENTARNATLAASRAEFPTVLDLLIGPA